MKEEIDVERANALRDDEEQDEPERHQRHDHRAGAEGDEGRREHLAPRCAAHVASAVSVGSGVCRTTALRVIDQISKRDRELTMSVMMNSTRPISTSAAR